MAFNTQIENIFDSKALESIAPVPTLIRECIELTHRALNLHENVLAFVQSRLWALDDVTLRRARLSALVAGKAGRDLMVVLDRAGTLVDLHGALVPGRAESLAGTLSGTLKNVQSRLELGESVYDTLASSTPAHLPLSNGRRHLVGAVSSIVGKVTSREAVLSGMLQRAVGLETQLWGVVFDSLMFPSGDAHQDWVVRLNASSKLYNLRMHVDDLWETIDYLDFWWYQTLSGITHEDFATKTSRISLSRLSLALRVGREIIRGNFRRKYWVPCKKPPAAPLPMNRDAWDSFDRIWHTLNAHEVLTSCATRKEAHAYICNDFFWE